MMPSKTFLALLAVTAMPNFAATVSFDLSAEADKDLVFERQAGATAEPFGENPEGGQAFAEGGAHGADGLPPNRTVASASSLGDYHLIDYSHKNAIELATSADAPAESHTIDVPDWKYRAIGILAASVDGDASFTIKLQYKDGSESVDWLEADDWYMPESSRGNCVPAVANMDRVVVATGDLDDQNHYQVYEFVLKSVDPAKVLDHIVIGNDPNRFDSARHSWGAVFAVNGEKAE